MAAPLLTGTSIPRGTGPSFLFVAWQRSGAQHLHNHIQVSQSLGRCPSPQCTVCMNTELDNTRARRTRCTQSYDTELHTQSYTHRAIHRATHTATHRATHTATHTELHTESYTHRATHRATHTYTQSYTQSYTHSYTHRATTHRSTCTQNHIHTELLEWTWQGTW